MSSQVTCLHNFMKFYTWALNNSEQESNPSLKYFLVIFISLNYKNEKILNFFQGSTIFLEVLQKNWVFDTSSDFFNSYIFATQCRRPLIYQTMNNFRSIRLSLKYQRFTPSGCKDIGIRVCDKNSVNLQNLGF